MIDGESNPQPIETPAWARKPGIADETDIMKVGTRATIVAVPGSFEAVEISTPIANIKNVVAATSSMTAATPSG